MRRRDKRRQERSVCEWCRRANQLSTHMKSQHKHKNCSFSSKHLFYLTNSNCYTPHTRTYSNTRDYMNKRYTTPNNNKQAKEQSTHSSTCPISLLLPLLWFWFWLDPMLHWLELTYSQTLPYHGVRVNIEYHHLSHCCHCHCSIQFPSCIKIKSQNSWMK